MKICNDCNTVFKDFVDREYDICPIIHCAGGIIDIDENLHQVYLLLNSKGYVTKNCCAGHTYATPPSTYISFWLDESFDVVAPELPDGFMTDAERYKGKITDDGTTTFRKCYDEGLSSIELQKEIWKTVQYLMEWAENLEDQTGNAE